MLRQLHHSQRRWSLRMQCGQPLTCCAACSIAWAHASAAPACRSVPEALAAHCCILAGPAADAYESMPAAAARKAPALAASQMLSSSVDATHASNASASSMACEAVLKTAGWPDGNHFSRKAPAHLAKFCRAPLYTCCQARLLLLQGRRCCAGATAEGLLPGSSA